MPDTVLRIAHHRGVCTGGPNAGDACTRALDCDGGVCDDACNGGSRNGLVCAGDGDCPSGGHCGTLFDAAALAALAPGGGAIVLPKQSIDGVCEVAPHANCGGDGDCTGGDDMCVAFALEALNAVTLDSLATRTPEMFVFTQRENVDGIDRNGDTDTDDTVVTLRDRRSGFQRPLGAPDGFQPGGAPLPQCGIAGTPDGRPVVELRNGQFTLPALAFDEDVAAFLRKRERTRTTATRTATATAADAILRVFQLDAGERVQPDHHPAARRRPGARS